MIPIEVGEPSTKRMLFQQQQNKENIRVELETMNKVQEVARIEEEATKLQASRKYNTKVQPWAFQPDDLIWPLWGEARKDPLVWKLGPNWESPFRVIASLGNEAYRLQELDGKAIPRTWNGTNLKFYFSEPAVRPDVVLFFLLNSFVPQEKNQGFDLRGFNEAHSG